jgi:hypothetical protein
VGERPVGRTPPLDDVEEGGKLGLVQPFLPVPGELQVVALAGHADDDGADAEPDVPARDQRRTPAGWRKSSAVSMRAKTGTR